MSYGQKSNIGICFQDSYGTAKTNSMHWLPHSDDSVSLKKEQVKAAGMRGIFEEGDSYEGKNTVDGDTGTEVQAIPLGAMLKAIFGQATLVTSGALYKHTYKPATADFDELSSGIPVTLHQYLDTGSAELFYDLNGKTLELSMANGELMMAKLGWVGGSFSQVANLTALYPTGKHFTFDVASLSIGGSAKAEIQDLTLTVDEGREPVHTFNNSLYPSRIKRTAQRGITVSGTIKFDNQTEYQQFLSQSERQLVLHYEGNVEVQSGFNESITMTIPGLRYTEFGPNAGGAGEIEVGFNADAKYHAGSGTALQITVVNTHPAY